MIVTVYPHGIGRDVERGEVVTTCDIDRDAELLAAIRALSSDHRAIFAEAPNGRCPRCGGPAYVGLRDVECERTGGCRTAEERVAHEEAQYAPCVIARVATRGLFGGEPYWQALSRDGVSTYHPTRARAIAAWREQALAVERRR